MHGTVHRESPKNGVGHVALLCLHGVQSFLEQHVGAGGDFWEALQGMEGGREWSGRWQDRAKD